MVSTRFSRAIEAGEVSLPAEGTIAVFLPRDDFDLSMIAPERISIIHHMYPDYITWKKRGFSVGLEPPKNAVAAVVCLPRARALARAELHRAALSVPPGAPIVVDGQKHDGIEPALKELRLHVELSRPYSKGHGKTAEFAGTPLPDDWQWRTNQTSEGFVTSLGSFSADGIDPASAALAEVLPGGVKGRVADLGAGCGFLSQKLLRRDEILEIDLIEADYHALNAARLNISDRRANFHWADARTFETETEYNVLVSNPPFHTSRQADTNLGQEFIKSASRLLAQRGRFFMVANRHLPYESALQLAFAQVTELPGPPGFKIIEAKGPRGKR